MDKKEKNKFERLDDTVKNNTISDTEDNLTLNPENSSSNEVSHKNILVDSEDKCEGNVTESLKKNSDDISDSLKNNDFESRDIYTIQNINPDGTDICISENSSVSNVSNLNKETVNLASNTESISLTDSIGESQLITGQDICSSQNFDSNNSSNTPNEELVSLPPNADSISQTDSVEDCSTEKTKSIIENNSHLIIDQNTTKSSQPWHHSDRDNFSTSENFKKTYIQEQEKYPDNPCITSNNTTEQSNVSETYVNVCAAENYDGSDTSALMKLAELACETKENITSIKSNENYNSCSENNIQEDHNLKYNTINLEKENNDSNVICKENVINNTISDNSDNLEVVSGSSENLLKKNSNLNSNIENKTTITDEQASVNDVILFDNDSENKNKYCSQNEKACINSENIDSETTEENSSAHDKLGVENKKGFSDLTLCNMDNVSMTKVNSENDSLNKEAKNICEGEEDKTESENVNVRNTGNKVILQNNSQDENLEQTVSKGNISKRFSKFSVTDENSKTSEQVETLENYNFKSLETANDETNFEGTTQFIEKDIGTSTSNFQEHLERSSHSENDSNIIGSHNENYASDPEINCEDGIISEKKINEEKSINDVSDKGIISHQSIGNSNDNDNNENCNIDKQNIVEIGVENEISALNGSIMKESITNENHGFSNSPIEVTAMESDPLSFVEETEKTSMISEPTTCLNKDNKAEEILGSLTCETKEWKIINETDFSADTDISSEADLSAITLQGREDISSSTSFTKNLESRNNMITQPSLKEENKGDSSSCNIIKVTETSEENSDISKCPKIFVRRDLEEVSFSQNNQSFCSEGVVVCVNEELSNNDSHLFKDSIKEINKVKRPYEELNVHTVSSGDEKLIIDEGITSLKSRKKVKVNIDKDAIFVSNRKNNLSSNSIKKKSAPVEVVDLVDVDTEYIAGPDNESTEFSESLESSKNFICKKCKVIWNDKVLKLLFEGNESVTVNSRITYGAIICMNIYVSINYPSIKEQALIGLLDRADLAKNLGSIQVSVLNSWLVALIKNKKISCCDPFRPVYRLNRSAQSISDKKQKIDQNQEKDPLALDDHVQENAQPAKNFALSEFSIENDNVEKDYEHIQINKESTKRMGETTSNFISSSVASESKGTLTIGKVLTKHFAKSNPISHNIIQRERDSLSTDLKSFYDRLFYEPKITEEEAKIGKRKYLTNKEVLNAHSIFIFDANEIQLDLYFKFLFQLLHHRERVLLITDGKSLVRIIESVRKVHNRQKFSLTKNKNFLSMPWDPDSLFTAPLSKLLKKADEHQVCVRDILGTFCFWKNYKYLKVQENKLNLNDEIANLFEDKAQIDDCFSLCMKLFSNYCSLLFDQGENEIMKIKIFLNLLYLQNRHLCTMPDVVTFTSDISFLPSVNGNLSNAVNYLEKQNESDNRVKRSHPDSLIECKLQQTKKLRAEVLGNVKSTKVAALMETYARLTNEMSYFEDKSNKDSVSDDSQTAFRKSFNSYTPEIKLMAAKLRAANVDTENIPIIVENIFHKIFKRKVPMISN